MGPEAQERQFAPQRDLSQMLLQGLMALTSAEDVDLGAAYERITNAKIAVREKNAEQVREILDGALERFAVIGQRRHEFSKAAAAFIAESAQEGRASDPDDRQSAMAGRRQQGRDGQTGTGEPRAPRERQGAGEQTGWLDQGLGERFGVGAMGDAARAAVVDGMLSIIARARTLTDDEFTGRTDAIAREIEQLLSARQAQRTDRGGDDGWPAIAGIRGYETAEQKAAAAERIRTKLRVAGEEYMEAKASGRDTALIEEVDGLLTRARISLYAEEYIESEELVNEAMRKLGLEVEPVDADAESTRPRRGPGRGR